MKRPIHFFAALACLVPAAVACTSEADLGSRSGTSGGQNTPASLVAACGEWRSATVARGQRCSVVLDDQAYLDGFDALCARVLSAPGAQADLQRFAACAEKVRALACDVSTDTVKECDVLRSAKGTLPDGSPCAIGLQCASGSCADGRVDITRMKCGTCQPTAAVGESCAAKRCADDAICSQSGDAPPICKPALAVGTACSTGDYCGREGYCDFSGTETCRANPRENEICATTTGTTSSTLNCAGELRCIGDVCKPARALGDACTEDSECDRGLACSSTTGKCVSTRVGLGGACGAEAKTSCDRGFVCFEERCVEPLAPGAACKEGGIACAPFHYCGPSVTCEPIDPNACK